jgi:hypothetical protein
MEELLEAIRAATAADATDEAKAAGATACRTLLTALEAKAGEPLAAPVAAGNPVQAIVGALKSMPPEQLMDLAIARLKAALPAGTEVAPVPPLRVPLVAIPRRSTP